jgi:hypothetical protein
MIEHETFWSLFRSLPHWEFELFLLFLSDGVIGALLIPAFKRWTSHHQSDDNRLDQLEKQVKALQERIK